MIDKPCLMDQCSDVELYKAGEYFCNMGSISMYGVVASVIWDGGSVPEVSCIADSSGCFRSLSCLVFSLSSF